MTEKNFQVELRMCRHGAKPWRLVLDGVRRDDGDVVRQGVRVLPVYVSQRDAGRKTAGDHRRFAGLRLE